jgi:flavin reductase (DIM6/NTAB) family NADH-FMN oxidoreductase RutF
MLPGGRDARRSTATASYTVPMNVRPGQLPYPEFYRILISSVAPRPIAWVSTLNKDGRPNLAPFSFFNVVSGQPPMLGFSPALRRLEHGHTPKDTLRNIRDTGEFVVNIVTFENAVAMNLTSGEYELEVNEFEVAKLATRPFRNRASAAGGGVASQL